MKRAHRDRLYLVLASVTIVTVLCIAGAGLFAAVLRVAMRGQP